MLIEAFRYDENGNASYRNHDGTVIRTDLYALVKVKIANENTNNEITEDAMGFQNVSEFWEAGYRVMYEVLGGISHADFWETKHFAPRGIQCSRMNLEAVCQGRQPVAGEGNIVTEVLQQDNYVIDSRNELVPIEELL